MSIVTKLLNLLSADWKQIGRAKNQSHMDVKVVEHTTIKIMSSGGEELVLSQQTLAEFARTLGRTESEVQQHLTGAGAERVAELMKSHSMPNQRAVRPARRVECDECHRTVARGNGFCMYCGADLHVQAEGEVSSATLARSSKLQVEVDAQFVEDKVEPQERAAEDGEQQAFLRRISKM